METKLEWNGGLKFTARGGSGHRVIMDASEEVGGSDQGPRPLELLLHGLAGCTAIDVILILKKMKAELTDFRIEVKAARAETHPKKITRVELLYFLKGRGLEAKKVERAIRLSQEKYCSASSSLSAEIGFSYQIEEE